MRPVRRGITVLRIALSALRRNLLRALLTALGIIIGIAAVISMIEIGEGSASAIKKTMASMGANTLLIFPGTAASGGVSFGAGSVTTLTVEDAEAIAREVPTALHVAPVVRARTQVVYGNKNWVPQNINGTTVSFLDVRDWNVLEYGEMFGDRDVRNGARVCVLGQTLVRELFGSEDPIGKEVRVQNVALKVVGVLRKKGANMMGSDQDDILIAPWTTIKYRISGASSSSSSTVASSSSSSGMYPSSGTGMYPTATSSSAITVSRRLANIDQILVAARSAGEILTAIDAITVLLRQRHRLRGTEPDDFTVRDMTEMTKAFSSTSAMLSRLLLSVALISLIVGGVGIMNIMLVSVTERTREIGLRMAVGARTRDILRQFLVEALVLCMSGGVAGVVLGRICSYAVSSILGWPIQTSLPAILAAFSVSVTIGLIFGYYPAWKASRLDPIEALRYE